MTRSKFESERYGNTGTFPCFVFPFPVSLPLSRSHVPSNVCSISIYGTVMEMTLRIDFNSDFFSPRASYLSGTSSIRLGFTRRLLVDYRPRIAHLLLRETECIIICYASFLISRRYDGSSMAVMRAVMGISEGQGISAVCFLTFSLIVRGHHREILCQRSVHHMHRLP